jgi:hypothetical protein
MVVDMRLSAMLLLDVTVRDVYVLDACVVVVVAVGGEQVPPVLPLMQVVRHVKVLVTVLDGLVLMTPRLRHQLPPSQLTERLVVRPYTVQRPSEMEA